MEFTNADVYYGEYKKGKRNGVGALQCANGDRIEGNFVSETRQVHTGGWGGVVEGRCKQMRTHGIIYCSTESLLLLKMGLLFYRNGDAGACIGSFCRVGEGYGGEWSPYTMTACVALRLLWQSQVPGGWQRAESLHGGGVPRECRGNEP